MTIITHHPNRGGYPSFTNLLFAIPLSGRFLPPEIMFSFHSMAMPMNYNNIIQTVKGKPVAEAREHFAEFAVANNCKYIFFWDEDVACPPQTIPELIYKMEQNENIAVCGGVYCLKRNPSEPLIFMGNGNGPYWDWKAGDFFECTGLGMGCTVVKTECLKDLKKPWFKTIYSYDKMLEYGIPALESWTEDLFFCQRLAETNGKWKVFVDTSIICKHYDLNTGEYYTLPEDSKPFRRINVKKGDKRILDVGSMLCENGHYKCDEGQIITCDYDDPNSDYSCDLSKLPFESESFDIVFSPALEYFSSLKCETVLKEWLRVLKPSGELRLVVENMTFVANEISAERLNYWHLHHGITNRLRKNGFTKDSIKSLLESINISSKNISFVPSDAAHIGVRAKKS